MILEFGAVILGLGGLYIFLKLLPPTKAMYWKKRIHEIDKELLQKAAAKYRKEEPK